MLVGRFSLKTLLLFFCLNAPFWVMYFLWPRELRLAVILAAFVAMWSLWVARRERKHMWTSKLRDIWLVQILWCVATVEANTEFYYKHTPPSVAVLLVAGILMLTVKGVFNGDRYTVNQP